MINLCIVGSGDVVQVRHADILRELSDFIHVKCIVSSRQNTVDIIQERLGYTVKRVGTLDQALGMGIDAALVAVPPLITMEVASYLSKFGIAQYIEKPLAEDVIAGAKFIEDVTEKSLPVVIGENFRNQERFSLAHAICESCVSETLKHIVVKDTLRRGVRTNPRTDERLFLEHFVHIVSSARMLSKSEVSTVLGASRQSFGSITEYKTECILSSGVKVNMSLSLANTWSEDRYLLMFDGSDTRIGHNYNFEKGKYTDTIEHYHGVDDLISVVTIPDADCGMRQCWNEFLEAVETGSKAPSPSLLNSLRDVQVREAVMLSLSTGSSIPIIDIGIS